jgi:hypothetical protein
MNWSHFVLGRFIAQFFILRGERLTCRSETHRRIEQLKSIALATGKSCQVLQKIRNYPVL